MMAKRNRCSTCAACCAARRLLSASLKAIFYSGAQNHVAAVHERLDSSEILLQHLRRLSWLLRHQIETALGLKHNPRSFNKHPGHGAAGKVRRVRQGHVETAWLWTF